MRSAQAGTAPLTGQPRPGGRRRARGAVSRLPTRRAGAAPAGKTQVTSVFSALAPGLLQPGVNLSPGVVCTATGQADSFVIQTTHPQAVKTCTWTSNTSPNLTCS